LAKKTLLTLVQNILSSMDADEVNSISDTVEALQVAAVVGTVYEEMIDNSNWPHLHKLSTLESVSDVTKPTHMKMAVGLKELTRINYNIRKDTDNRDKFTTLQNKSPEEFLNICNSRNSSQDNVTTVIDFDGAPIYVFTDTPPTIWTTFDDDHIVFDSFDSDVESTLQESKTQILGWFDPSAFTLDDNYIPDLPSEAFTKLLAESKSTATFELNQETNDKAEQLSRRSSAWLSMKSFKIGGGVTYRTNYGRNVRKRANPLLDLSSTSTRSATSSK